ncbi:MAG: 23S rRNA pseudouridine(955/2504/2580) synthase RluC [bacterium]
MHNKVRTVTVDEGSAGQRIDNFLLRELKGVPRTHIYRLLRKGEVRVNKGRVKPTRRLEVGDLVRIPPVRTAEQGSPGKVPHKKMELIEDAVIFEDDRYLFVNKPSGMAVHGGSGVSFGVIELLRASRPNAPFLELAHRLDRDTSGCLMLAKKRSALRTLQDLQRRGRVDKRYQALLWGQWRRDRQQVTVPLKKNTLRSGERVVRVDPEGKSADTSFRVLKRFSDSVLVEAKLGTGRTHQIRVHTAWLGTPILGDDKYGDEDANRLYRDRKLRRLFLHAEHVVFKHPESGTKYDVRAPLGPELEQVLNSLESK